MTKSLGFYEPWNTMRSQAHESAHQSPPDPPDHWNDCDKRQSLLDWKARAAKARRNADCIIFGSGMSVPTCGVGLLGKTYYTDGSEVIAAIRHTNILPDDGPGHVEIGERIAACVNAMEGVRKPESFMRQVREILTPEQIEEINAS